MQRLVEDLLTLSALESEQNRAHGRVVRDRAAAARTSRPTPRACRRAAHRGARRSATPPRSSAAATSSRARSATSCPTRSATRLRAERSRWRGASTPTAQACSRSTDTGIGIAPEHLPRLTERFYRVDRSRSRATGGTGLGLAIVKHVLLRHQADLEIASEPGKGSTFSVRLPARRVRRAPTDAENVSSAVDSNPTDADAAATGPGSR